MFFYGAMIRDVSPSIEDVHLKSRSEEKEKTLKLIEQKLKSYEEKKELEGSNQPKAVKKKGHFWSDCKVQLDLAFNNVEPKDWYFVIE